MNRRINSNRFNRSTGMGTYAGINCGCFVMVLVLNLAAGGWSVNYLLSVFSHKIPFIWAAVIGLFSGEFTIPAAIIVAILKHFGVL